MKEYTITLRLQITEPLLDPAEWCWGILLDLSPAESVEVVPVLTTAERMVLSVCEQRRGEIGSDAPLPTVAEIDNAIDASNYGRSIGEFIGAAWEDAHSIVYDEFPQFREPEEREPLTYEQVALYEKAVEDDEETRAWLAHNDRDPYDVYGTPEHEAWLMECEYYEG
jgi:hypothetical protein